MPLYEVDYSYDVTEFEVTQVTAENEKQAFEVAEEAIQEALRDTVYTDLTIEGVREIINV